MNNKLSQTLAANLIRLEALKNILIECEKQAIPVIVMRGAALAEILYDNPGERIMDDIDLLVKKESLASIKEIMKNLNYAPQDFCGEMHFHKNGIPWLHFDIHENLWYMTKKEFEEAWNRAIPVKIAGISSFILHPEDFFIEILAHTGVQHGKFEQKHIEDMKLILKKWKNKINLDNMIARIKQYNLTVPFYYLFSNYNVFKSTALRWEQCNVGVPQAGREERSFLLSFKERFELTIYKQFLLTKGYGIGNILKLFFSRGVLLKLTAIIKYLFPGKEFLKQRYNIKSKPKVYIYYFLRPFFLLSELIKLLFFI